MTTAANSRLRTRLVIVNVPLLQLGVTFDETRVFPAAQPLHGPQLRDQSKQDGDAQTSDDSDLAVGDEGALGAPGKRADENGYIVFRW